MQGSELKTRESLIERLKDREDKESWREFFNLYWQLIYGFAIKAGLGDTEAEEVVQETMITISNKLDDYVYEPKRCSFKSWMFHKARWRIIDQIRKRDPGFIESTGRKKETTQTATPEKIPDQELPKLETIWEEEWEKNLLEAAMERVKDQVSARQYQMFNLYVVKEWSVKEVKQLLHVNAGQVYLAKHRISGLIKKEIKKLEVEMERDPSH